MLQFCKALLAIDKYTQYHKGPWTAEQALVG